MRPMASLPKDRGWGMGGHTSRLVRTFLHLQPRERPVRLAAVPGGPNTLEYYPAVDPFAVPDPIGGRFPIGNPGAPVPALFIQTFGAVPEPGTWSLLILGFGALGWRARLTYRSKTKPAV